MNNNVIFLAPLRRAAGPYADPAPAAALRLHRPMGSVPDAPWNPPNSRILSQLSWTLRIQIPDHISNHLITRTFSLMSIADYVFTNLSRKRYIYE